MLVSNVVKLTKAGTVSYLSALSTTMAGLPNLSNFIKGKGIARV